MSPKRIGVLRPTRKVQLRQRQNVPLSPFFSDLDTNAMRRGIGLTLTHRSRAAADCACLTQYGRAKRPVIAAVCDDSPNQLQTITPAFSSLINGAANARHC